LLVYFHNKDNITKLLGYCKKKMKLFSLPKTVAISGQRW